MAGTMAFGSQGRGGGHRYSGGKRRYLSEQRRAGIEAIRGRTRGGLDRWTKGNPWHRRLESEAITCERNECIRWRSGFDDTWSLTPVPSPLRFCAALLPQLDRLFQQRQMGEVFRAANHFFTA